VSSQQAAQDPPYGWVVVMAAAVCMAFGNGSLLTLSVFLKPLVAEFGWLRGEVSFAYLVGTMALGAGGIAMGWLADRYPVRWLVLAGAAAIGIAFGLLAHLTALWQLHLLYALLGGVAGAACFAPLIAITGNWFERRKGLALGITTAGQSLGYAIVPFLARELITTQGWRATYTALAVLCAAVVGAMALLLRDPPGLAAARRAAAAPSGAAAAAATPAAPLPSGITVAWLSAAALFSMTLIGMATVHVVALAQDAGIAAQLAASVLSVMMVGGILGRVGMGRLADRLGGLRTALLAALAETLLVFGFVYVHTLAPLLVLGGAFGMAYGGVMTCYMVSIRELVPLERRGTSVGILAMLGWVGIGLGGWQGGALFDLSGAYTLPFAVAAAAGVVNVALLGALWLRLGRAAAPLAPRATD
jgi:MFS family permease